MTCTFFGHKDTPEKEKEQLRKVLLNLIIENNVDIFYVGNNGNFDFMVQNILDKLKNEYPIRYYIVLAYMPTAENNFSEHTILPETIENVPKRFAISYRNNRMIEQSDYVVTYVRRSFGGAAQFEAQAKRKHKTIIAL